MRRADHILAIAFSLLLHGVLIALILRDISPVQMKGIQSGKADSPVIYVNFVLRDEVMPSDDPRMAVSEVSKPQPPEEPLEDPVARDELDVPSDLLSLNASSDLPAPAMDSETHRSASERNELASSDGSADDLEARYHAALRLSIGRTWSSLSSQPLPEDCSIVLSMGATGAVLSAKVEGCEMEAKNLEQLEAATLMSQPLPYEGFESVFSPSLELHLGPRSLN